MKHEAGAPRDIVPLPRFLATFGYAVLSLIVIGTALELGAFATYAVRNRLAGKEAANAMLLSPAYDGYPWAQEYWKEERARWAHWQDSYVPFRIWGAQIWNGKYIHTDTDTIAGAVLRKTVNPVPKRCSGQPPIEVWLFGGSTVYGTGVPDFATLPSYLSEKLNAGPAACVDVINLGVEGYVTNQEVVFLIELLRSGARPRTVVFYDGLNDAYAGGFAPGIPSAHLSLDLIQARIENGSKVKLSLLQQLYSVRLARAVLHRLDSGAPAPPSDRDVQARAEATLRNYEGNLAIVRALAGTYHFSSYFFWQPTLFYGNKPPVPFEKALIESQSGLAGGALWRAMSAVYQEAAKRSAASAGFFFLGRIFDGVKEPLYIDSWMHLGPRGNRLAAQAIAERIERAQPDQTH